MVFLAKSPLLKKYDLSSVKRIGSGAAPLSAEIQEETERRFKLDSAMTQGNVKMPITIIILILCTKLPHITGHSLFIIGPTTNTEVRERTI